MEINRNLTACSMELLDDPALKTTATNYEFKYVPGDQFQRVIRTVQRDRLKQQKDSIWSEFCSAKKCPLTSTEDNDHVDVRSYQDPRNIIKTKASTIKIISQPIVETKSEDNSARESYKAYKMPKIRVMTDDEIKNVVENAFKEVIEQNGNGKMVSQLLTTRKTKKKQDAELISSIPEEDNTAELLPKWVPNEYKQTARSPRILQPINDDAKKTNFECQAHCPHPVQDSQLNLTDDEENPHNNNDAIESARSNQSVLSARSDQSSKHDSDTEIPTNFNSEESDKEEEPVRVMKEDPEIIMEPGLTCLEKEEFRKFLGIRELIVSSDIDLDRYENKSSSSSEVENENEELASMQNIEPIIHIRQPTPRQESDDSEEDIVLQYEDPSPRSIAEMPLEVIKSPRKKTFSNISPRKRFDTSPLKPPLVRPPPIKSPQNKPSQIKSPQVRSSQVKSPRQVENQPVQPSKKLKKIKSPQLLSDARQQELKQEQLAILSKITTYQMKIIEVMHQIRSTLNEIPEPDGNMDAKRRERHTQEFTTRFARNYLYQIGRWTEELRVIPTEQYISKCDNEFRVKVCNLFGILYQAIQSYLKHMNSFLVDRNPRKLPVLIDAINESTKMCVHKKVFDREDDVVQELLHKTKSMRHFLNDLVKQIEEAPNQKPKKTKNPKILKSDNKWDASRQNKKLSMYDTLPTTISGVKRKGLSLKETVRSRTSIRSLSQKPSTDLRVGLRKPEKKIVLKPSAIKLPPKSQIFEEKIYKDDVYEIQTPCMDQINTHVETMLNDESQEILTPKPQNCLVENIIADVNGNQAAPIETSERGKDINNTVIEALESITKQQVQHILGPLMSNLGILMTDKTGTGMNVHTLLNSLGSVTSRLVNDPTASGETLNRQDGNVFSNQCATNTNNNYYNNDENNFINSRSKGVSVSYDVAKVLDNTASCERELATNRFKQQQSNFAGAAAPAPNAFGELRRNNDETFTSPPYYTTTMPNTFVGAGDGTRAPRNCEGQQEPVRDDEGGDYGARTSEVETRKVQQLRYDRNVQFTFVTSNEETVTCEPTKTNDCPLSITPPNTPSKQKLPQMPNHKDRIRQDRMHFIEQLADNPLYVNEYFSEPWKIVTKIANQIVSDAIGAVETSVNFGEETFVKDFIRMELES